MVDSGSSGSSSSERWSSDSKEDEGLGTDEKYKLQLIQEVRKRERLWRTNISPKQWNRDLRKADWLEVACKLHSDNENGRSMSEEERMRKVDEARKKWKNMKDCFKRYIDKKKRGERGCTYRYFKQLKFLKQNYNTSRHTSGASTRMSRRDHFRKQKASGRRQKSGSFKVPEPAAASSTTQDHAPSVQPSDNLATHKRSATIESKALVSMSTANALSNPSGNHPTSFSFAIPGTSGVGRGVAPQPRDDVIRLGMTPFEASLLELLRSRSGDEFDEDKNFALSLIPMLRELDYEKKHYAKTKILHVMKCARYLAQDPGDLPVPNNYEDPVNQGGDPVQNEPCSEFPSTSGGQPPGAIYDSSDSGSSFHSQRGDDDENSTEEQNARPELRK